MLENYDRITMERFASLVNISYRTLKRYVDAGQLVPRRTLGGKPYFLLRDVETYKKHTSQEPLILAEVSDDADK